MHKILLLIEYEDCLEIKSDLVVKKLVLAPGSQFESNHEPLLGDNHVELNP